LNLPITAGYISGALPGTKSYPSQYQRNVTRIKYINQTNRPKPNLHCSTVFRAWICASL